MTSYSVTTGTTKLAWIHDGPAGVASTGHFNCVCGNTIAGVEYAGPDSTCSRCERVWDGRGWLVSTSDEEQRKGYQDQMAWLQGKSIPEAYQALDARQATLGDIAYNRGGTLATADYIAEAMTRAIAICATSPRR
jgi:hypothetical protein